MPQHDAAGREYAKLSELKAGDIIELDSGFTCHEAGKVQIYEEVPGILCFECDEGHPQLYGQIDYDGNHLVGIYKP